MTIKYTAEVGRKFNIDGTVRPFAGTTVIAFLDVDAPIVRMGAWLQAALYQQPFGRKFSYLPISSFHMTVIQLLNDQDRTPERWTSQLALDASMAEICTVMGRCVGSLIAPDNIRMRFTGIKQTGNLAFQLEPADGVVAAALRHYRNAVADATGVRLPDHEHYQYHISLAYRLIELTPPEQQQVESLFTHADEQVRLVAPDVTLPPPQFTRFEHMFRFVPDDTSIEAWPVLRTASADRLDNCAP